MDLNDDDSYDIFTNVYRSMVDKQALLKSKNIRVYQPPIMKKEFSKCVMIRSEVRNKCLKCVIGKMFWPMRKQKVYVMFTQEKTGKQHFQKFAFKETIINK